MKKETVERITKVIPGIFKNVLAYIKDNFDEKGQKTLENATGSIGILIKLFGKPIIDKYFEKKTGKKLENFGLLTYLKAAFVQAGESLEGIKENQREMINSDSYFKALNDSLELEIERFDESDVLLVFQPKYHPAVLFVKDNYLEVLR
ncbi:MAG: hypothetical protein GY940_04795, partial [bacterium]|nr:hypothetical protein [bacterium]